MQSNYCNISSYPNTEFLKALIESLGVKVRIDNTRDGKIVSLIPKEAIKIPLFFPNETISQRYNDLKVLTEAMPFKPGSRIPPALKLLIREYGMKGYKKAEIMKILTGKHRIAIRYRTLSRCLE